MPLVFFSLETSRNQGLLRKNWARKKKWVQKTEYLPSERVLLEHKLSRQ
jgi:hypothetical protein